LIRFAHAIRAILQVLVFFVLRLVEACPGLLVLNVVETCPQPWADQAVHVTHGIIGGMVSLCMGTWLSMFVLIIMGIPIAVCTAVGLSKDSNKNHKTC
jgi:ABC-type phosphate transport system permease subunit